VLHYTRLESFARDKHSSILGLLLGCEENIVEFKGLDIAPLSIGANGQNDLNKR